MENSKKFARNKNATDNRVHVERPSDAAGCVTLQVERFVAMLAEP
jgi:hypothetical protein